MENQLPKNWVETELKEIISYVIGGDWGKDPEAIDDDDFVGVLCIRGSEIKKWSDNKGNTASLRKIKKNSLENRKLEVGDILIEISGGGPDQPVGRTVLIDKQVLNYESETPKVCTNFLRLIRIYNTLNSVYVNHYFHYFYDVGEIVKYQGGSNNLRNLKFKEFETIQIPLPPLAEQNRIVAKLDALFMQHEAIKKSIAKIPELLKNFRQQVLTQAVTGKLTEEWRKGKELECGKDFTKRIIKLRKESGIKKMPGLEFKKVDYPFDVDDSWTFGFLQNFGEFTRGKSKHRPRNDVRLFGGIYPFIQTGEVSKSNGLITKYKNTYSDFGLAQSRLFPKGTLCITIAANIAETGILNFDSCFPDSVVGYLPFEDYYSSKFAMFYFNTIQKDLEHYAPATAQKNINLGILFEVPFPVPPHKEQQEIVNRVESLFAKADAIEKQYESLKVKIYTLPQAILHKAFKGELSEQLDTDGDARELLKQIQELKKSAVKPKKVTTKKVKNYPEGNGVLGMVAEE